MGQMTSWVNHLQTTLKAKHSSIYISKDVSSMFILLHSISARKAIAFDINRLSTSETVAMVRVNRVTLHLIAMHKNKIAVIDHYKPSANC